MSTARWGCIVAGVTALSIVALVASSVPLAAEVAPQKKWQSIRTPNFHVLGDAGERQLRDVAARLEQFREAIGILLPKAVHESSVATTVLVFRSHKSFNPFKPVHGGKPARVAGFFLPTPTANYIALTTEGGIENLDIVYHEYVHLVVNNTLSVPTWFNEGLAEYFRSFVVSDNGQRASLGKIHDEYVLLLRQQFVPLDTLVGVGHDSPLYNEGDRRTVFYAESWALVHFLMLAEEQKYARTLNVFVDALSNGSTLDEAAGRAFALGGKELEQRLRSYVGRDRFRYQAVKFTERISNLERLEAVPVPEAEVHAVLGDLLMHMQRPAEAQAQLEFALTLDTSFSPAHASLGMLHIREGRLDQARGHLKQAMEGHGGSYLTSYYYAYALTEAGQDAGSGARLGDTTEIEAALRRAIELNPGFPDAYGQLAWYRAQASDPDDAIQLLRRAIALAPGRDEYSLTLAYLLLQKGDAAARPLFDRLAATASEPRIRDAARGQVEQLEDYERRRTEWAAGGAGRDDARRPGAVPGDSGTYLPLYRDLGPDEVRLAGELTAIVCNGTDVVVHVRVEGQEIQLRAKRFDQVEFITYREDLQGKQVQCGPLAAPESVLVSYRPAPEGSTAGLLVAVEFVPR